MLCTKQNQKKQKYFTYTHGHSSSTQEIIGKLVVKFYLYTYPNLPKMGKGLKANMQTSTCKVKIKHLKMGEEKNTNFLKYKIQSF